MSPEGRERLRQQLARDEGGYQRWAYQDSEGYWTIGFGRCIDRRRGPGISLAEAELMLDNDIRVALTDVLAEWPWAMTLSEARLGALVNLRFNLGLGGLRTFRRMLAAMERGDWEAAARELLDSAYHRQVGLRAERLAEQIRSGLWQ